MSNSTNVSTYDDSMADFFVENTIKIDGAKCACLICQKIFRNPEFLKIHLNTAHADMLESIKQSPEELSYKSRHIHQNDQTIKPLQTGYDQESTLSRAERQAYIDFSQDTKSAIQDQNAEYVPPKASDYI